MDELEFQRQSHSTVLAIIPARGGSKGVVKKNIRLLMGKPLIAYTIEVGISCSSLDRLIVSTNDDKIAGVARAAGAEVPFLRPDALAQDDTRDLSVCQHALRWLMMHEKYYPEIVVWLRPTSPLRTVQDIEATVQLLVRTRADCVRSICPAEHHPYWMKRLEGNRLLPFVEGVDQSKYYRRQELPPAYRLNGAVDVTWCKRVIEKRRMFDGDMRGYVMPVERSVDLDSELDFALAELLVQRRELR